MVTSGVEMTAMEIEVEGIASLALELAKTAGADDAKVEVSRTEGRLATVRGGVPSERSFRLVSEISITVYRDGKRASTSTSDLSRDGLNAAVTAALHIAAVTAVDEAAGLADMGQVASSFIDLDLCHTSDATLDEMVEYARRAEAAAYAADKAISTTNGASVSTSSGVSMLATSRGFMGAAPWSMHSVSCAAVAVAEGYREVGWWSDSQRIFADLIPGEAIGEIAARRALGALKSRAIPTQVCPVLFEPIAALSLLSEFTGAASGEALYRGGSFLADRIGAQLFSEDITISEDPFVKRGMSSRCFDADGIPGLRRNVVHRGILAGYFLGLYASRRLKMQPTGNGYGPNNLEMHSTKTQVTDDFAAMLKKLDRGLVVTEMAGGGVNRLNGDFSRAAKGFWVENGEIQFAVSGVTVASNLNQMYLGVRAIGSDKLTRGGFTTGSWLLDEMKIGGV